MDKTGRRLRASHFRISWTPPAHSSILRARLPLRPPLLGLLVNKTSPWLTNTTFRPPFLSLLSPSPSLSKTMESRILFGATTVPSLPRLRKPPTRDAAYFAAVARPIGEGGNLIWGRKLRPALLLETSPATSVRREILRPLRAAASSPGEGSDFVG